VINILDLLEELDLQGLVAQSMRCGLCPLVCDGALCPGVSDAAIYSVTPAEHLAPSNGLYVHGRNFSGGTITARLIDPTNPAEILSRLVDRAVRLAG
jgi:hypothetical protein